MSGAWFAVSVVCFRGASLALSDGGYLERAGFAVAVAVTLQTVLMSLFLGLREPGQMTRALGTWRISLWVGVTGMLASACWFTAITLQNAAVVRAVGQAELIFTVMTSVWLLGERLRGREIGGMVLVVAGIILLI